MNTIIDTVIHRLYRLAFYGLQCCTHAPSDSRRQTVVSERDIIIKIRILPIALWIRPRVYVLSAVIA